MRIKEEKGFAVTDIAISIIIITIFIAMIANLIVNVNLNSKEIERKTQATSYAIQEIEKIKIQGINTYIGKGIDEQYIIEEEIINSENDFSGYHKKIIIEDYVLLKQDRTKKEDILKKVTIEISYKIANKEKDVTLVTYLQKEG